MTARRVAAAWAVAVLLSAVVARALPVRADAEAARTTRYDLRVRLDAERHVVTGEGRMAWTSDAREPVDAVRLHLYLNAFRDRRSTFLLEASHAGRAEAWDESAPGSIDLTALRLVGEGAPTDLLPGLAFVSPEDGNPDDRTVAEVALPRPVAPGETVEFEVAFTSRLPRPVARSGFGGDFHLVTQWFPKFGVWQDVGEGGARVAGWNARQYHAAGEFFADYGTYDVRITVPEAYEGRVGATGRLADAPARPHDGTVTYAYHAEDVHDFAWVAGARLVPHEVRFSGRFGLDVDGLEAARVARILGRSPSDLELPPVDVLLLLQPEHEAQLDRHRRAVFEALTWFGLWYGPYPYSTLTVVDPDARARATGGMEYPNLVALGTTVPLADDESGPEGVTIHEIGHQWFYGLVGSDETTDAWLDEGLTTFVTGKVLERAYGPRALRSRDRRFGVPMRYEPPFEIPGALAGLRRQLPFLDAEIVPFARLPFVADLAARVGAKPAARVAAWPKGEAVTPATFLRDLPPLAFDPIPWRTVGEHERTRFAERPDTDAMLGRASWRFLDGRAYGNQSYRRAAGLLRTLEAWFGEAVVLRGLRSYADTWRYRHPTPDDLVRHLSEAAGEDLSFAFDEMARDGGVVDYGVHAIDVSPPAPDRSVESRVTVRRLGGARLPVDVWVGFEDGTTRRFRWERDDRVVPTDGGAAVDVVSGPPEERQYRWTRLRFRARSPVRVATTDPERRLGLEVDRTNDGLRREARRGAADRLALRLLGWIEQTTTFYGGL